MKANNRNINSSGKGSKSVVNYISSQPNTKVNNSSIDHIEFNRNVDQTLVNDNDKYDSELKWIRNVDNKNNGALSEKASKLANSSSKDDWINR